MLAQVPWLGRLLLRYPLFAGGIKSFRAYGRNRALLRKKMGSSHKDIFHHLVRTCFIFYARRSLVYCRLMRTVFLPSHLPLLRSPVTVCQFPTTVGRVLKTSPFLGSLAIVAGSDTTSSAITNLLYFLMTHPTAYKRLQAEVDELGDDLYDCTKQVHLPYLTAAMLVSPL